MVSDATEVGQHQSRSGRARADVVLALTGAASGAVIGVLWRALAPVAVDRSQPEEGAIAVDLTLGLLWVVVAVAAALFLVLRQGEQPTRRLVAVAGGLLVGGAISWGVGLLLGISQLGAIGAAFVAAPLTALVVFLSSVLDYVRRP